MSWKGRLLAFIEEVSSSNSGDAHKGDLRENVHLSSTFSLSFESQLFISQQKQVQISVQTYLHILIVKHLKVERLRMKMSLH